MIIIDELTKKNEFIIYDKLKIKKSEIINKIHSLILIYLIFGCILESQRKILIFIWPH